LLERSNPWRSICYRYLSR